MPNSTTVTEFLLTRFSDVWEYRALHAMLILLMYLATLMGNLLTVTVTTLHQSLHTSGNLSVLDMCYISVTVPKAHVIFLLENRAISIVGCAAQIFLMLLFLYTELLFLTIMSFDHYVAICQHLHFPVVMNPQVCVQMTLTSILRGLVYSRIHTGNTFGLPFCKPNVVFQFFCEVPSLLKLSCSEISSNEILIFVSAVLIDGGCFACTTMPYCLIFSTVLKFPTRGEQRKAFSTCVPHILVATTYLSSGAAVYVKPISSSPTMQDIISAVFYSIVHPFLNAIIYGLRNKQIKEPVKKVMRRKKALFKKTIG